MNGLETEKQMALSEFISMATDKLVHFVIQLAIAIVVFYVGRFLIRKIQSLVHRLLERRKADPSIASFLRSGVEITLYFLLIIVVIGILGIETSSFIALFASAGVAVGMALSGTLQNFAGGVLVLWLKPYAVGEYIEAQGYAGTVKEIMLFNTVITTPDNKTIIIPNGPLFTGSINNYSRQPVRRVDWTVAVAYGTDFEAARAAIREVLASIPQIITGNPDRSPDIFLGKLADSSVDISVRAWVGSADYWDVFFTFNEKVYAALPQAGIHFPFPQLDVHMVPKDV